MLFQSIFFIIVSEPPAFCASPNFFCECINYPRWVFFFFCSHTSQVSLCLFWPFWSRISTIFHHQIVHLLLIFLPPKFQPYLNNTHHVSATSQFHVNAMSFLTASRPPAIDCWFWLVTVDQVWPFPGCWLIWLAFQELNFFWAIIS